MVTSVYGKCNSQDIRFNRIREVGNDKPDRSLWTCTVPRVKSGVYVIELWAEDDAGNTGYFATVKLTVEAMGLMRTQWELVEVGTMWTIDEVCPVLGIDPRSYARR